jgi:hypothetical protein
MFTPDVLSLVFLSFQHVSAGAKLAVSGKLAVQRLVDRYPFTVAALLISAGCQAWLLSTIWLNPTIAARQEAYQAVWRIVTPFQVSASFAIGLEALWVMARHYPRARTLMLGTVAACAMASIAVVLPYAYAMPAFMTKARSVWKVALLVGLVAARALLLKREPGMSRNARLHIFGVLLAMSGSVVGDLVGAASRAYAVQALSKVILIGVPLAACRWWWQMQPAGEIFTPTPGPTLDELEAETKRVERAIGRAAGQ